MRTLIPALALTLAACTMGSTTPGPATGGVTVKATSYPAFYLAKRIGAPRLTPEIVLEEGADPATWQPSGEEVAGLAEADLILVTGAGYESWVKTATLPTAKVVDTSAGLELVEIEGPTHSHGVAGEHSHTGTDPLYFVDPARLRAQAKNVHAALVKADPEGQRIFDAQLGAVERNIDDLVAELDPVLTKAKERPMAAAHPSFTYLADRAGWTLPILNLDVNTVPSPEAVAAAAEGRPPGTLLLWDAPPSAEVRSALPSFEHVVLDPLTLPRGGQGYDYFAQARLNRFSLDKALATPFPVPGDTDAPTDTDAPAIDGATPTVDGAPE